MDTNDIAAAENIVNRRLALLESLGEDKRNTIAWREALAESAELNRRIAFSNWRKAAR